MVRSSSNIARIALCLAALLLSASAAFASPAPAPVLRNVPAPWIGYAIMAVLLVVVVSISLLPSKRSHQD